METDDAKFVGDPEDSRNSPEVILTSLTEEQQYQLENAGFKTIVINDQAIDIAVSKEAVNIDESSPSTSFRSHGDSFLISPNFTQQTGKRTKYNWDNSVHDSILPVRCRNISGELHKNRFGSGGRGRCIKVANNWYTPSAFEAICGRANSKDWKRSIRYAGRTLQCLIEEGLLQPHATSCTCSACCDDETVSGPVRLFTPYKRRKKDEIYHDSLDEDDKSNSLSDKVAMVLSQDSSGSFVDSLGVNHSNFISDDSGSVIVAPVPSVAQQQLPARNGGPNLDFQEQRHWWQLEEMVKNLARQVQEVQKQVEAVKAQSLESREISLQQLRLQMENEKKEALNTSRIEAQMNLSRAILEARSEKELAVQEALREARANMVEEVETTGKLCINCNREAFSDCTGCNRVSYCGSFCQRKDWPNHRNECHNILNECDIMNEEKSE